MRMVERDSETFAAYPVVKVALVAAVVIVPVAALAVELVLEWLQDARRLVQQHTQGQPRTPAQTPLSPKAFGPAGRTSKECTGPCNGSIKKGERQISRSLFR